MVSWIKQRPFFIAQIILFLLGIAGGVYVAVSPANSLMRWYSIDDAFYYYKVAQNVLTGHGFTFDQINLTNGFHPLWMVVCLGVFWLSRYNLLLPLRFLVIVSALFNSLTGVFLFKLLGKALKPKPAFIGALTWILLPSIYSSTIVHGMEAAISAFFMVAFLLSAATVLTSEDPQNIGKMHFLWIGLLGALTILSRLDNIFMVAAVGIFLLLRVKQIKLNVFLDLVVIAFSGFISWIIRLGLPAFELDPKSIYPMVAAGLLIKPICYYFAGLYVLVKNKKLPVTILRLLAATVIALIVEFAFLFVLNKIGVIPTLSKSILLIDAGLTLILVFVLHLINQKEGSSIFSSPFRAFANWFATNWRRILIEGALFALPIALLLGVYVTLNKVFFGTFTPVSGQIKTWWSTLPNTIYGHKISLLTVLGLNPEGNYGPWSLVTSQLFGFAETINRWFQFKDPRSTAYFFTLLFALSSFLVLLLLNAKHGKLAKKAFSLLIPAIMLGATVQIMYYTTEGYQHTRSWYWLVEMLAMVMLGSILLEGLFMWLRHSVFKKIASTVIWIGLVIYITSLHVIYIYGLAPQKVTAENQSAYLNEVKQIETLTEEGSLIGMTGGGNMAYFLSNRTVVNLDGLINSPAYFHALKTGTAQKFLDDLPLDYALGNEYALTVSDPYNLIFTNRLEEIGMIHGSENFTLYKYVVKE